VVVTAAIVEAVREGFGPVVVGARVAVVAGAAATSPV
jgi:hypothetical protein